MAVLTAVAIRMALAGGLAFEVFFPVRFAAGLSLVSDFLLIAIVLCPPEILTTPYALS